MGMRSGKVLKAAKKTVARAKPKPAPAKKAAPPKVITKTVTKTVEVDRNRALRSFAQRIVDVTVANDDHATLALYSDGIESKEANNPASVGLDAIKEKFVMWRGMTSDATFTPRSVVVDGNTIMIEWEGRVTLAATGRVVDLLEVAVHEIRNGQIIKERFYYDPAVLQG